MEIVQCLDGELALFAEIIEELWKIHLEPEIYKKAVEIQVGYSCGNIWDDLEDEKLYYRSLAVVLVKPNIEKTKWDWKQEDLSASSSSASV